MSTENIEKFADAFAASLDDKTFVKMTLGNYRGTDAHLQKLLVTKSMMDLDGMRPSCRSVNSGPFTTTNGLAPSLEETSLAMEEMTSR